MDKTLLRKLVPLIKGEVRDALTAYADYRRELVQKDQDQSSEPHVMFRAQGHKEELKKLVNLFDEVRAGVAQKNRSSEQGQN